jgi:hypothetical protein
VACLQPGGDGCGPFTPAEIALWLTAQQHAYGMACNPTLAVAVCTS